MVSKLAARSRWSRGATPANDRSAASPLTRASVSVLASWLASWGAATGVSQRVGQLAGQLGRSDRPGCGRVHGGPPGHGQVPRCSCPAEFMPGGRLHISLLVSVPAARRDRPGRWPPPKLPSTRRCRQLDRSTSRGGAASAVSKIRVSSDVPEPSSTTVSAALRRAMSSARSTSLKSHPERSHPARSANDRSGWTLLSVLLHSFQARGATTSQPLMHEGCHCLAMVQRRCACRKLRPPWSGPRRRSSLIVGGPDVRGCSAPVAGAP